VLQVHQKREVLQEPEAERLPGEVRQGLVPEHQALEILREPAGRTQVREWEVLQVLQALENQAFLQEQGLAFLLVRGLQCFCVWVAFVGVLSISRC
jgi:hypothetical protein